MAVSLYFGLPGSGKTTLLTKMAIKAIKGKRYKNVYCNVHLNIPGLWYIEKEDFGSYQLEDGIILYDEATIDFDSRDYKNFSNKILRFYMLHRHYRVDIALFAQGWDTTDKRIRQITDRVFYLYKTIFMGHWVTKYYRIPYGIDFNNPKKADSKYGEIIQGYCKPPLIMRICASRVWRPKYYKYFDSFEAPKLPELPAERFYKLPVINTDATELLTVDDISDSEDLKEEKEDDFLFW